jgi:hypothetical protein
MSQLINNYRLPSEILEHTFGFLALQDIGRSSYMCKEWQIVTSKASLWKAMDLAKILPLKVLDERIWKTHADCETLGLDPAGVPALQQDKAFISFLKYLCANVEGDAGVTVLTIPKGLTLNKLQMLANAPKKGNRTFFETFPISRALGDVSVSKTYRVIMTNNIIKCTRGQNIEYYVEQFKKSGFEIPDLITIVALTILTYISSQAKPATRLYNNNPSTITVCSERVDDSIIIVGDFTESGGLDIRQYLKDFNFIAQFIGLALQLKV